MALDDNPVIVGEEDGRDGPPKRTPEQIARYWLDNISSAEKKRKPYITRGKQILKRYRNKRTLTTLGVPLANRRMNVLWSNVQTLKPVLYSQTPKANVSRRNKSKDPIGRTAAIVLQNCLQNSLGMEDFDFIMNQVVDDRLLPGCGLAMVEYVPTVEEDQVGKQAAETRYLQWEDYMTNVARVWQEVVWFGYKVYLTRKECYDVAKNGAMAEGKDEEEAQAFAEDVWREITLDHREDKQEENRTAGQANDGPAKAVVWCIWDKTEKQIIQISPGYPRAPLAILPPPVNYDGFFPIPRPLQATTTNDTTNPVPDFEQYVDQADEIDLMTQRIGTLAKALRLRGLYPADMDSLKMLVEGGDADMIPYDNWQMLSERGGAEALIVWFPVEAIAKTLIHCIEVRQQAMEAMYEITGLSDLRRGQTEASETATAQQLKAQYGAVRTRDSQREVQRFIRDLLRLKTEVICEKFSLQDIKDMSGVKLLSEQEKKMVQMAMQMWQQFGQAQQQFQQMQAQQQAPQGMSPPPPNMPPGMAPVAPQPPAVPQPSEEMVEALEEPSWEQVLGVLQNERLRGFVVDVETDSTVEPDQQAQQAAASEFLAAVTQFMAMAGPMMMQQPDAADMFAEMLSWAANQWKGADTIVGAVDEFTEKVKKQAEAAKQNGPPPSPEMAKVEADAAADKMRVEADTAATAQKLQLEAQATQQKLMLEQQKAEHEAAMKAQELQFKMQLEERKLQMEAEARDKDRDAQQMLESKRMASEGEERGRDRESKEKMETQKQRAERLAARAGDGSAEDTVQDVDDKEPGAATQLIEKLTALAEGVSRPRKMKIVRGPDGRIAGAEEAND